MLEKAFINLKEEIRKIISEKGVSISKDRIFFEQPKDKKNGDYSCNISMMLARELKRPPRDIARDIVDAIDLSDYPFSKIEIAGAGFINLYLEENFLSKIVFKVNREKEEYGNLDLGKKQDINIEYVSANPTGFLHAGHCRGAAYGDSLARIMKKAGYNITREYYVNDAGNQINNLIKSIYQRYLELYGKEFNLDDDCYHGPEIIELAKEIKDKYQDKFLNEEYHDFFRKYGIDYLIKNLKKDLEDFNITFDVWFSEKSLYDNKIVDKSLEKLKQTGYTYEKDGALWLKTSEFNDEKDRVLIKSDGFYTYLTPDIAYHMDKLSRSKDGLIDVLGADHHGYINRLKAGISILGGDPDKLDVQILQLVRVLKDGQEVKMSKRSGKAITMKDLLEEIGSDAARYIFVSKALSTQMDLDLDLAVKQSNENPVYYAQYAYARIQSMFRRYKEFKEVDSFKVIDVNRIDDISMLLLNYEKVIKECSLKRAPHKMCQYINSLAGALHSYYNDEKIICEDETETNEKLTVMKAVSIVLKDALDLIGVKTKEKM